MFLDSVQDYAFISFDLDRRVVGWSRGAERILGYQEADVLGLPGSVFFTPEDVVREEDEKEFALAREVGRAEDERWHLRRDGSRFWGSGVMTPLVDVAGRLRGYSKVMRDNTARRLADARLRDSEERLRLFSENVGDYALVPVDLEGMVVGWNPGAARIFGYTADEILGQHCARFFTPADVACGEPDRDFRRAIAEGKSEYEREMVRKDGSVFWAQWVTTPIRDEKGQLRGFAKVLQDTTDRKLAQERLRSQVQSTGEALDRTKEELRALAGSLLSAQEDERRRIARELHDDLSQRLAGLANNLAALQDALPDEPARLRTAVQGVEHAVGLLASEVRQLSHRLHPSILDDLGLGPAIRRLVEDFQVGRAEPATFIKHTLPEQIPRDVATAVYRITQEALRNITKHGNNGLVRVELGGEASALRLVVSDTGPGFDPAMVRGRGGLGIISMQERAGLVGGNLRLISRRDHGTTIEVRVPLAPT
ncbi:MAG TPA: PAS domain S-box protein [Nannocystis sp.]